MLIGFRGRRRYCKRLFEFWGREYALRQYQRFRCEKGGDLLCNRGDDGVKAYGCELKNYWH